MASLGLGPYQTQSIRPQTMQTITNTHSQRSLRNTAQSANTQVTKQAPQQSHSVIFHNITGQRMKLQQKTQSLQMLKKRFNFPHVPATQAGQNRKLSVKVAKAGAISEHKKSQILKFNLNLNQQQSSKENREVTVPNSVKKSQQGRNVGSPDISNGFTIEPLGKVESQTAIGQKPSTAKDKSSYCNISQSYLQLKSRDLVFGKSSSQLLHNKNFLMSKYVLDSGLVDA